MQLAEGWGVLHLFLTVGRGVDTEAATAAIKRLLDAGDQVVTFVVLGHKADLGLMALGPDLARLRRLQTALQGAGFVVSHSYISLTEVSEYARGMPDEAKRPRLYPELPPDGKRAICFYPMSKRRNVGQNWYSTPYELREDLMRAHGAIGRTFAGRVVQLITGSTGLDDWEWGVTLFANAPDDLKDVVYTMRFDEASAQFAEFGPFFTGMVGSVDEVFAELGLA
jgi:hydrogen peroxide-dependent heme synthase